MNTDALQVFLENEWSEGVLWRIRIQQLDLDGLRRILDRLRVTPEPEASIVSRRLVAVLWYLPQFLNWNLEQCAAAESDLAEGRSLSDQIAAEVERLLGVP